MSEDREMKTGRHADETANIADDVEAHVKSNKQTEDASPADDGSAAPGNSSIFNGWGEVSGRDSLLFLNANWVA